MWRTILFIIIVGLFGWLLVKGFESVALEAQAQSTHLTASVSENICNSNLDILEACCK